MNNINDKELEKAAGGYNETYGWYCAHCDRLITKDRVDFFNLHGEVEKFYKTCECGAKINVVLNVGLVAYWSYMSSKCDYRKVDE